MFGQEFGDFKLAPSSEVKPTNPKDALGIKKVPMSTIPATVLAELGVAMLEGAMKYGRHNYRAIGVRASVYYDASLRHHQTWWEGEDTDPDSGLSHITKAIASLVVLRDAMIGGNWVDDRPPTAPPGWMAKLNDKVTDLIVKYPDPVNPYTEVDQTWARSRAA
jgi:dATP/dGTP diphosphohydrolase